MTQFNQDLEAVIAPKLIITVCGTLQVHAVFIYCNSMHRAETSNETLMEQLLNIKVNGVKLRIQGESKTEKFVDSVGGNEFGFTINLTSINYIGTKSNKSLLLLLYKYAINNYYNKDLVNAYATLDVVKKQFNNLWDQLSPLSTFKFVEPKMEENMKKEYEEHAMKTLEYVDKFSSLCFSSNK